MRAGALVVGVLAALAFAVSAGAARPAPGIFHDLSTSTNWSGYAATGTAFTDVKGTWVQPAVSCDSFDSTYSAFWVGLGGYAGSDSGLEQIGTESDCMSGRPVYSVWYELLPAASTPVTMQVSAGDTISAEVSVNTGLVTLTITDATTGATFSTQATPDELDISSAEWVAEAPSQCGRRSCRPLPLANFGTAAFSGSSATANGHAGTISDTSWASNGIELQSFSGTAVPSALSTDGSSFSVSWQGVNSALPAQVHHRPPGFRRNGR
jgi:Peptidase A4 family